MVAILVLATFVILIAVDYFLHREKYQFPVVGSEAAAAPAESAAGVSLPAALAYHPGHTWALNEGNGHIRVGVDEFAAALLGQIDHLDLPKRGRWLQQGDRGWTVFTDHGPVNMPAPAEGEVIAINEKALLNPGLVENDPYNSGWLIEIRSPEADVNFRNLLSGNLAMRWMEDSVSALRKATGAQGAAVPKTDGIQPHMGSQLQEDEWTSLTSQFFRC
jgi:glycine cleavage system H protein